MNCIKCKSNNIELIDQGFTIKEYSHRPDKYLCEDCYTVFNEYGEELSGYLLEDVAGNG